MTKNEKTAELKRPVSVMNMEGVSLADARVYAHYCHDRVRLEDEVRDRAASVARD
jgi:hypothetical protein